MKVAEGVRRAWRWVDAWSNTEPTWDDELLWVILLQALLCFVIVMTVVTPAVQSVWPGPMT